MLKCNSAFHGSRSRCWRSCAAGCGESRSTGAAGKAKDSYTIGMSQCNLGEPWRVQMNADIKAAADKHPEPQGGLQGRAERHAQAARRTSRSSSARAST